MSANCTTNIVEIIEVDPCHGERLPTSCVIHPTAIPSLNLPINSTQEEINNLLILALQALSLRVTTLETTP